MLSAFVTLYIGIAVLGMTLAQLGLLLFVLNRLNAKVKEFNAGRQAISQNMAGLLLVKDMTVEAASRQHHHVAVRRPSRAFSARLVLADVTFEYPDTDAPDGTVASAGRAVLKGVSVAIPAGSFTAVVGRSGSRQVDARGAPASTA